MKRGSELNKVIWLFTINMKKRVSFTKAKDYPRQQS